MEIKNASLVHEKIKPLSKGAKTPASDMKTKRCKELMHPTPPLINNYMSLQTNIPHEPPSFIVHNFMVTCGVDGKQLFQRDSLAMCVVIDLFEE